MRNIIKNIVMILITLVFLLMLDKGVYAASTGVINTETVRMRQQPSTSSEIVALLSEDFKVEIISEENNWSKVKYKEYTGYISSQYITKNNTADKEEEKNKTDSNIDNTNEKTTNEDENDVYILPLVNAKKIGTIKSENYNIIKKINNWVYISSNEISGWIETKNIDNTTKQQEEENKQEEQEQKTEEIQENTNEKNEKKEESQNEKVEENKSAYINTDGVNFRKKADKSSEIIDVIGINEQIKILSEENGWYKIKYNNITGYVAKDLVSDEKVQETASSRSLEEPRDEKEQEELSENKEETQNESNNNLQEEIVAYAKTFLGYPYVYGGTSPSGFDCSGFVQYVYKHFGYNISRSSVAQAKDGVAVEKGNLQPGDIVIFKAYNDYSRIGHVGLYIGNNQFIHANDESTGIIITSLSKGKYPERFVTGRRII